MKYSDGFKARIVQRMAGPERATASRLADEVGIHQTTLSRWLREATEVKREKRGEGVKSPQATKPPPVRPDDLPPAEKLRLVMEASTLPDGELGAFLRRHGLHEAQLDEWRRAVLDALQRPKKGRPRTAPDAKKIKALERELDRKDKALAEVTALLALKKKLDALLGDEDDDTSPRSAR